MNNLQFDGPVVLAILDGVGLAPDGPGNAVSRARTEFLGLATRKYLHVALDASGEAVGLPRGQMGNSEVGHNTLGSGEIVKHGVAYVDDAMENGTIWRSDAWREAIRRTVDTGRTLHFAGIFSDGGVHSHIRHLEKMIERAYDDGVRKIRVHAILDGRDVAPDSALNYVERLQNFARRFPSLDIRIASGGGRMTTVADRYENDWSVVERGWRAMVEGASPNRFENIKTAITHFRSENPEIQDQYLPDFTIVDKSGNPVGKVDKNDVFIYFDFRPDRAIEIAQAFTYIDFPYFDRHGYSPDNVYFIGLTEYNTNTHVPEHRLLEPAPKTHTFSHFISTKNISDLAVAETVKFGHVTYFFNDNSYELSPGENSIEVQSDTQPFETRPWMKSAEVTDAVIDNLEKYKFIRLNFPGGDMVGHTANLAATIIAMEAIDLELTRIYEKVRALGGCLIIVADHGNAEEVLTPDGQPKTSHTTNKVPFIICDDTENRERYELNYVQNPGLANVASTLSLLLGQSDYPEQWQDPLIHIK